MIRPLARRAPGLNWQLIVPVVAGAGLAVGLGMLVCLAVALAEGEAAAAFAIPAVLALAVSALALAGARRLRRVPLRPRDGFLAVTLAWVVAALAGAAPFALAGTLPYADACFEAMSGFTTTGATLLSDIEGQPDAILLWRSLSQWLGGVGIVVLVVAIAPATGLATQRVFYAETSGVTADRLTPRIADTARIIWGIYLALTAAGFAAYLLAGMDAFDAVNHILTTIATGGFSTRDDSMAAFDSVPVELVAIVFMTLGGINFAFYWRALRGMPLWPQLAEVRLYLLILLAGVAAASASLALAGDAGTWQSLRDGSFAVVSVMTSTGYTTSDFDAWNDFARALLLLLMFVGGCAGSTAGGMKVIRVLLLGKAAGQEVGRQLRPSAIQVLRTRGRVFSEEVRRGVLGFFLVYMGTAAVGTLAMLASGLDLVSATAAVAATLNVIGPGIGEVGATDNYAAVSDGGRVVLWALMLIGRLEVFTVLVLLTPAFWRRNIA